MYSGCAKRQDKELTMGALQGRLGTEQPSVAGWHKPPGPGEDCPGQWGATAGFVCLLGLLFGVFLGGGEELFWFWFIFGHNVRDLSSLTRDRTRAPKVEAWSTNHWPTREVPLLGFTQKSEV